MKYKAIIFDFDGVLNDTEGIKFDVWKGIAEQFGKRLDKQFFIKNCTGRSGPVISAILSRKYSIPLKPREFAKRVNALSRPILAKKLRPIQKNIELLKKSYKIFNGVVGLASSQERGILVYSIKKLKIEKYIKEIISGDEIKNLKPMPDIYLAICKKLKANPKDCIVVEDSQAGVESAYDAHVGKIIAIPEKFTKTQDFSKAHLIVSSELKKIGDKKRFPALNLERIF